MHPAIQAKSLMWRRRSWGFWICRFINFNPWFVNYSDGHFNPYPYVLAKPCITSYILRLRPLSSGPLHIYVQDQSIAHPYLQRSSISSLYLFTKYIRLKSISHTKTGRAEAESQNHPRRTNTRAISLAKRTDVANPVSVGGRLVGLSVKWGRELQREGNKVGSSVPNTL